MKLFIAEDDLRLLRCLERDLIELGYQVEIAWDGMEALKILRRKSFDLVLLDGMLPGLDGYELLQRYRETSSTPVIMITARDAIDDRVNGLRAGADDYLVKPYHFDELVARIEALLRRNSGSMQNFLTHGDVALDPDTKRVTLHDKPVELTAREYLLLHKIMSRKGNIFSNDVLASYLSSDGQEVAANTVEVHISRLRKKLGKELIRTIRGLGYIINPIE